MTVRYPKAPVFYVLVVRWDDGRETFTVHDTKKDANAQWASFARLTVITPVSMRIERRNGEVLRRWPK